jgi:hypothetical protein
MLYVLLLLENPFFDVVVLLGFLTAIIVLCALRRERMETRCIVRSENRLMQSSA